MRKTHKHTHKHTFLPPPPPPPPCSALYAVVVQPVDFGTFFLTILLSNLILLLIYYVTAKALYRERPSYRVFLFLVLALANWAVGIYFYSRVRRGVEGWVGHWVWARLAC